MIKKTRVYRYIPSFDEVMSGTHPIARHVPSFDDVMSGNSQPPVNTVDKIEVPQDHNISHDEIDPSKYETKLNSQQEQQFQSWFEDQHKKGAIQQGDYNFYKKNGYGYDYDFRAAFLNGENAAENGHWSDIGKKPNHETFSDESKYNGVDGHIGGKWDGDKYIPAGNSLSNKEIPTITIDKQQNESGTDFITPDAIKYYKQYQDNVGKKIDRRDESGFNSESIDDPNAKALSDDAESKLKSLGFDANDDVLKDLQDMPKEAFYSPKNSIETFKKQKEENPIEYNLHLNGAKTQWNIYNSVYDKTKKLYEGDPNQDEIARTEATRAANKFNENNQFDSYESAKHAIASQQELINNTLEGDQRETALQRLKESYSHYFNPANHDLQSEYAQSGLQDKMSVTQYAGLKTIEAFNPDEYKKDIKILKKDQKPEYELSTKGFDISNPFKQEATETETEDSINSRIGFEKVQKGLDQIGRNNAMVAARRSITKINSQYASADDEQKAQLATMFGHYKSIIDGAIEDEKKDDEKYPLTAQLKFDDQTKELLQKAGMNPLEYGIYRFGKGLENSLNTVENIGTSVFGSDEQKTLLTEKRLGESAKDQSIGYLPESFKSEGSQIIPKFSKELVKQKDEILNNKDLSDQDKQIAISNLVQKNQDQIDYITNPDAGKDKNFWSKATLYSSAGTIGDIASIVVQSYGLGSLGAGKLISSSLPMFTTTQNEFYKQALNEGKPNPGAYANSHALIMALAGMVNPDLNIVKRSFGLNTALGKTIAGIDEGAWNAVVNKNKPLIDKFKNSVLSVGKEATKMSLVYGAGTSLASDLLDRSTFNKDISGSDMLDHAVKSSKDIVLNSMALFGLNAVTNFKSVSPEQKAMIWEAGTNKDISIQQIKDEVANGGLSQLKADQKIAEIKNISSLIEKVPTENTKGQPLTDRQKTDYLFNLIVKSKADNLKTAMPEDHHDRLDGLKAQADEENKRIYENKIPNLKEVTPYSEHEFTYDSEKDIPKVLLGVKPLSREEVEATDSKDKHIKVTYSGQQLIDAGLAREPFSEVYHTIKNAIENKDLKGMYADAAKTALESPEKSEQFLKEVADQALNKIASHAGTDEGQMNAAIDLYGKKLVDIAIESYPKKERIRVSADQVEAGQPKPEGKPRIRVTADQLENAQPNRNETQLQNTIPAETQEPTNAEANQNSGGAEEGAKLTIEKPSIGSGGTQPPATSTEAVNDGSNLSSIKNKVVDNKRKEFGLRPAMQAAKKEFGTTWDNALNRMESGYDPRDLVNELKKKSRPLSDEENAILLAHQIDRETELRSVNEAINKASDKKDESALVENQTRKAMLQDELQDIYDVGRKAGTENARGLATRRLLADDDYSLASMVTKKRAANNGAKLSDEQMAELQKKHEEIQAKLTEYEKRVKNLEGKLKEKQAQSPKSAVKKAKEVAAKLRTLKINKGDTAQANVLAIPVAIWDGAVEAIAKSIEAGGHLADAINDGIQHLKDKGLLNTNKEQEDFTNQIYLQLGEKRPFVNLNSPELIKAKADYERAKAAFDNEIHKDEQSNRSALGKAGDFLVKWSRAGKLSWPTTFAKLASAGVTRLLTSPIEDIVGKTQDPFLPKILKQKALGETGINVNAQAKMFASVFTKGIKDAGDTIKTGKSNLDLAFGDKKIKLPPEISDLFGQLHGAVKAPIKRAIFEKSLEKRTANLIKIGGDITDPMVQTSLALDAYKDANRAIFMQDNKIAAFWSKALVPGAEKHLGKWASNTMQWLIPFVKIPTNIVNETFSLTGAGLISGGAKLLHVMATKGLENLTTEEADMIRRNLKKGQMGIALLLYGYFSPKSFGGYYQPYEKRDSEDLKANQMNFLGVRIPSWLLHAPVFNVMQLGATVRRIQDANMEKGEDPSLLNASMAGALGLAKEVPLIDQPTEIAKLFDSKERKFYAGELVKNTVDPGLLQFAAKLERGYNPLTEETSRKPDPKTILEHVETGIPGLTEQVEDKGAKSSSISGKSVKKSNKKHAKK